MCASYGLEVVNDYRGLDERLATDDLVEWLAARMPGDFGTTRTAGRPLSPIVTADGFEDAWWWLWVRGAPAKLTAFNARSEKLLDSPLWRGPFRQRRVLIPATHYFERANQPGVRGRFRFRHPDLPLLTIAGIAAPTGLSVGPATSFAMVTRGPAAPGAGIHDRMPLLVPVAFQRTWLDPATPVNRGLVEAAVAASQDLSESLTVEPV